jgi:1,4-alpha-glucan branching enzyme
MARTATSTLTERPVRKKESDQPAALTNKQKKESFTYFAPSAENVILVGDFTAWEQNPVSLKRQKDGTWKASISLEPGDHEYRFMVDGQWQDDTECTQRKPNGFGQQNCIRQVR